MRFSRLTDWLAWQETLNPRGVELGLDRVRPVAERLGLAAPAPLLVTVGGTNGKGSCVAFLEAVTRAAGARVGAYLSPHLRRYNETVRVDGEEATDESLIEAFARVEAARAGVPLTWFEFRTLAVADLLGRAALDVAVLEVGLGGRLDAVNLFDADVAVVTGVALDHADWLGATREEIAGEKAGIFRPGRAAVCGDPDPPARLIRTARALGTPLHRLGRDFGVETAADGSWTWWGAGGRRLSGLPAPAMAGAAQPRNAACALTAASLLAPRLDISDRAARAGIAAAWLAGRLEVRRGPVERVFDVAHNPEAAASLAAWLEASPRPGRTRAVLAMLADKDAPGIAAALRRTVQEWHVAGLDGARGQDGARLAQRVSPVVGTAAVRVEREPAAAYRAAVAASRPGDRVVVLGSFETVRRTIDADREGRPSPAAHDHSGQPAAGGSSLPRKAGTSAPTRRGPPVP